ncbi:MAG: protein kinase domain-containing protein [Vicinamibacteria bacterium]
MARRIRQREGDRFGRWTLVAPLGSGGNGEVWTAESQDLPSSAVKILQATSRRDYERFRREVAICQELDPNDFAILPVLDSHLPEKPGSADRPWFAMPLASVLSVALTGASLDDKVAALRDVARTLARLLAERELHHRDVKPENLYKWEERFVVGDFGLAKRPEDPDLTTARPLGPFNHMPSEVLVGETEPDWERVDVYCLANSLWRLAAEKLYPPRGQIRANEDDSLALLLRDEPYIAQLAGLIEVATSRAPSARPTLAQFADQLDDWVTARATRDEFAIEYESAETRKLAVIRWLTDKMRREPLFDTFIWNVADDADTASEVHGLTEGQVAGALAELVEEGLVEGEPGHVLGRRGPAYFTNLYPAVQGLSLIYDLDALVSQAAPLLRALLHPADWVHLPESPEPVELPGGLELTAPEAYFQMWLLNAFGLLEFKQLNETGGHMSFMDVRATARGKRWLYESGRGR